ncbi:hypothetical protein [Microvirga tunisiensis]|uniref:Uncharacterized protein n=1 Tax=Microvirga tunisiensis TaxID=2108360 RepID=A0A5N7MGR8_9HYPH|nr:hypothetical protein [Microvirga tunisiensis]MPR06204.1 hypothetical protein [Microvirga tunisiensis]MPR26053.1 hypothetical protein [Microvirga tunisiensis]
MITRILDGLVAKDAADVAAVEAEIRERGTRWAAEEIARLRRKSDELPNAGPVSVRVQARSAEQARAAADRMGLTGVRIHPARSGGVLLYGSLGD